MPAAIVEQLNQAINVIVPELILVATVCVMLLLGPFLVDDRSHGADGLGKRWSILALFTLALAAWTWLRAEPPATVGGPFVADGLSFYVRMLSFALGAPLVLMLSRQIDDGHSAEANACLLAMLAGVNLVSLASDLAGLFLALELVSIPTYLFLYLPRRDAAMQEAAMKYFLLSIFSSALVLMGMAWLFGAAGSTNLAEIAARLTDDGPSQLGADSALVQAGLALLVAGLSFRVAAVPFHFYAPDVFQGVNSVSAAMLSVVPKIAGFAALLRVLLLVGAIPAAAEATAELPIQPLLAVLSVLTMFIGNVLAVRQRQLHRLLAYSSIAHSGYMLAGLAVGMSASAVSGIAALWFYLAIYGVTTVGLFALLAGADAGRPLQDQDDLPGLSQAHPAIALLMAVCLFGLAGLPPISGFFGKWNLFQASWNSAPVWGKWLAISIAVNAAIGASYYLRLIGLMYREPAEKATARPLAIAPVAAGAICAAVSIALFIAPQRLWDLAVHIGM